MLLVSECVVSAAILCGQQSARPAKQEPVSIDLGVTYSLERAQVTPVQNRFWLQGAGADASMTFWKGLGFAASMSGHHASNVTSGVDVNKISYLAGPRYSYTVWAKSARVTNEPRLQIFGQGLFGGVHGFAGVYPTSTSTTSSANAFALEAGGGANYYLNSNWGLRLFEASYVRTALPNNSANVQNDLRLAFGLTYHVGSAPQPPVTLTCSATPASVFPGDPVSLTATALGLSPRLNAIYSWAGKGVTGNGAEATVDTVALPPGNNVVTCQVKEGKTGKEGFKPGRFAESSTSFVVKEFEPPTIACSANPATIKPGETAIIAASAISPQNRPLSYSYSATAGAISGNGATAAFNSKGAPAGVASIACNVSDDKGNTATTNTSVTIVAPYVSSAFAASHTQALCSISFARDKKRPTRVSNEAKACLDEVALSLQAQTNATLVLVGSATEKEKGAKKTAKKGHQKTKVANFAAKRAVNAKNYLVTEKGIDAARIRTATSSMDGKNVASYLVPTDAAFTSEVAGTTAVDESSVKPQARKSLTTRHAHRSRAQRKHSHAAKSRMHKEHLRRKK
jgi:hypothetical protein